MTTKRIITLAAAGALAAVSTIAISVSSWLAASAADGESAVRLHIPIDGQPVFSLAGQDQVIQTVTKNSCVIANTSGQALIDLSSDSTTSTKDTPGIANYGLGVRESPSSGNGNPCAQITSNETLTLTASEALGRRFTKVRLDLEMTGNDVAKLTLGSEGGPSETFYLQTGTNIDPAEENEPDYDTLAPYVVFSGVRDAVGNLVTPSETVDACAKPSSSGPNSAGNDNCEWNVDPGFEFDTITLTSDLATHTLTGTTGTVTMEGGGDFTDGDHDTLFYVTGAKPVANDDSAEVDKNTSATTPKNYVTVDVLHNDTDADGDPLTVGSVSDPDPHGTIEIVTDNDVEKIKYTPSDGFVGVETFTYTAFDGTSESNSATVRIRVCSTGTEVLAGGSVTANFTRLTELEACKSNTVTVDASASTVLFQPEGDDESVIASYRGFISFGPKPQVIVGGAIQLILKYDKTGGDNFVPVPWCDDPVFNTAGEVTDASVPSPDTWCIASESTVGSGTDSVITNWQVFGRDDPKFQ
jgi:hypothetical protein